MDARLLLFDIDFTLLWTGGAGMRSMARAFQDTTGRPARVESIRPDGKTDPMIVSELFAAGGVAYRESDYAPFMERYLHLFGKECADPRGWKLMPGVRELLEVLQRQADFFPALLTGNDECGARMKLAVFDLNRFFPVGAFASDSPSREELAPLAIERASRYYQVGFEKRQVVIIGDAIGDVRCAMSAGVRCLAVTTGRTSAADLRSAGRCMVLPDLTSTEKVMAFFRSEDFEEHIT